MNYGAKAYSSNGSKRFTVPLLAATSHAHNSHTGTEVTADLVAAKGDLLGGSALDTLTRLAVGTDGQHLEADSAQATGLKWVAKPAGSDIAARAHHSVDQSISNNSDTVVALNSERFDTDTIHDNISNNSRLTATTAGKYLILAQATFAANGTGIRMVSIRLNGVTFLARFSMSAASSFRHLLIAVTFADLAATDYVEMLVYQNSGAALNLEVAAQYSPEFTMA